MSCKRVKINIFKTDKIVFQKDIFTFRIVFFLIRFYLILFRFPFEKVLSRTSLYVSGFLKKEIYIRIYFTTLYVDILFEDPPILI